MNESIMKALMRLFAIAASVNEDGVSSVASDIVRAYLRNHLSHELMQKYLQVFESFHEEHQRRVKRKKGDKQAKEATLNSVKVLMICQQINETLDQREKQIVFVRLIEFINEDELITNEELDFIHTVADTFNIANNEFENLMGFVLSDFSRVKDHDKVLVINKQDRSGHDPADDMGEWFAQNRPQPEATFKHIKQEGFDGEITILHLESTNSFFFRYRGDEPVYLNGQVVAPRQSYVLDNGSIIKSPKIRPIYYSDLAGKFLHEATHTRIEFAVHGASFSFKDTDNGIQPFNMLLESGQLVGIMGGSGVGKSTLFQLLIGNLHPANGSITINGHHLQHDAALLKGIIGYVPQDDLLIEELTVYQNLYYNAKLCFNNFSEPEIEQAVEKMLEDLDLDAIASLTVGNPLNKFISGGQRKRLNIALELIRQPSVLFVDEPTSGLSSMDSETVMLLLKEQTIRGKLVVVNIHQPSSDVYKLFDKLLILDKGGRMIYNGNPIDAISYFKRASHHVNPDEGECPECGNVNAEQVLQIVEARMVNELGKFTRQRKISAEEWYRNFKTNIEPKVPEVIEPSELPFNYFEVPGLWKQFDIFFRRTLRSKLTNTQYLLINALQAPLLAFILAYATKYIVGSDTDPMLYLLAENKNLPGFLFMGVIVALFLGLTVSAEEIIKDRRILQRESFLNLSRLSYINSKVVFLFLLSAFQTLCFVLIGTWVLEIEGMNLAYWALLFSTAAWANMVGLNISSALNSVVAIYILIPFILVPQLLLSGVMVSFEDLHRRLSSYQVVPLLGDLMVSRWTYEAMAVQTFAHNKFQKHFFEIDFAHHDASFKSNYLVPSIKTLVDECETAISRQQPASNEQRLRLIRNELQQLENEYPKLGTFAASNKLYPDRFGFDTSKPLKERLDAYKAYFIDLKNKASVAKEQQLAALIADKGKDAVYNLQQRHHNKALASILTRRMELKKIVEDEGRLVQNIYPVYRRPETNHGRAHFYAPYKLLGKWQVDTLWFNIGFVWLFSGVLYLALWHDTLRKLLVQIEAFRYRFIHRYKHLRKSA